MYFRRELRTPLVNSLYKYGTSTTTLIHTVHHNLFIFAYGLMNINDIPALIGIKEYFSQQVYDAEQTRIKTNDNILLQQIPTYFDFLC